MAFRYEARCGNVGGPSVVVPVLQITEKAAHMKAIKWLTRSEFGGQTDLAEMPHAFFVPRGDNLSVLHWPYVAVV